MDKDFEQREKIAIGDKTNPNKNIIRIQETISIKDPDSSKASTFFHFFEGFNPQISILKHLFAYKGLLKIFIALSAFISFALTFFSLYALALSYQYSEPIQHQHLYHFSKYYQTFQQYLHRIKVKSLLNINCNLECFLKQKQQFLQEMNVIYVQSLPTFDNNDDQFLYYDWVNYHNLNFGSMNEREMDLFVSKIKQMTKEGISLTWDLEVFRKFSNAQFHKLIHAFHSSNLFVNPTLSLKIRRFQSRPIEIFTPMGQGINYNDKQSPPYQLAIQAQIRLTDDFSYIPQWVQYNLINGVNYFFLYEVSQDSHIDCSNVKEKDFLSEWERFLQLYENNIIYIPWNKRISKQASPKNDYVYHYGTVISYSIFLKTSQIIFSVLGLRLSNLLTSKKDSDFSMFILEKKLFIDRMCHFPNSYMVENYAYYQMPSNYQENLEIFKTQKLNSFIYRLGINGKNVYRFHEKHIRINSYTGSEERIREVFRKGGGLYLSYDYSAESRIKIANTSCFQRCKILQIYKCKKEIMNKSCPKQLQKIQ